MWLLTTLLILLAFLIVLVIISTSMKIGLIITNRHNYDSRKLIIPSILVMILWMVAIFTFYLIFKNTFSNGLEDMILSLVMTPSSIANKKDLIIVGVILAIITILIQSFTYYAINIDYNKIFGYIRFKIKQILNIKPKENKNQNNIAINEEKFEVPFYIALITSILTSVLSILLVFGLYNLGVKISTKIIQ